MTGNRVTAQPTVYMDRRDITPWCLGVKINQPNMLERTFTIRTAAWHLFDQNARYDIYASYDSAYPRDECLIRQGFVFKDRRKKVGVSKEDGVIVAIEGKSYSAAAFRRTSKETLVLVPTIGPGQMTEATRVLRDYDGPIGKVRVVGGAQSLRHTVHLLCNFAQLSDSWNMPNYPQAPLVVPPGKSFWSAIWELVEPYAPIIRFNQFGTRVVFIDPVSYSWWWDAIRLEAQHVERLTALPTQRKRVKRLILRIPAWR